MIRRHAALLVALLALAAPSTAQADRHRRHHHRRRRGRLRNRARSAPRSSQANRRNRARPDRLRHPRRGRPHDRARSAVQQPHDAGRRRRATQPGYAGTPLIELNGVNMPADENGFISSRPAWRSVASPSTATRRRRGRLRLRARPRGNTIEENRIGTDPSGTVARPNSRGSSITNGADDTVIRRQRHLRQPRAGRADHRDERWHDDHGQPHRHRPDGHAALGNATVGVYFTASFPNVVGPGNVIAANGQDGVRIGNDAHGSRVRGSRIGIGAGRPGARQRRRRREHPEQRQQRDRRRGPGRRQPHRAQRVHRRAGCEQPEHGARQRDPLHGDLGIDMAIPGSEPNDDGVDSGAVNHPKITSVENVAGGVRVRGTLQTDPDEEHRVELFSSPECDLSGRGEGARFLGSVDVTTNAEGTGEFDAVMPGRRCASTRRRSASRRAGRPPSARRSTARRSRSSPRPRRTRASTPRSSRPARRCRARRAPSRAPCSAGPPGPRTSSPASPSAR